MTPSVQTFFDKIIPSVKKGFSPRKGQPELSEAIFNAYLESKPVIVEAPTGFGKSFAVLVPAIKKVMEHGGRVIISTETLTLQDQYIDKDLPLLFNACKQAGFTFTYAVAKGRGNYVCRDKINEDEIDDTTEIVRWARKQRVNDFVNGQFISDTGDIASVPFEFEAKEWRTVSCDEDCGKGSCPYYGKGKKGPSECFAYKAATKFMNSQIVVTNHTFLLLDAYMGAGLLLGAYDMLIVDEAHSLPEKAQDAWGTSIKPTTISRGIRLVNKILNKANLTGLGRVEPYQEMEKALFAPFDSVLGVNTNLKQIPKSLVEESKQVSQLLISQLKTDFNFIGDQVDAPAGDPKTVALETCKEKIAKLMHDLKVVYGDAVEEEYEENWLAFLETGYNYKREPHGILNLKPIDVGPLMSGLILDKVPATIMMSATMKINGSFGFMKRELGLPSNAVEFVGESPFDFAKQVVGYFPTHLPNPDKDEYLDAVIDEITSIIDYMHGRTMVLFTNMSHMRQVCDALRERVPYTCYMQGQAQKGALITMFSEDENSCLFATRSFFTGVDIPGATLSCVVLVKAPFRVPSEPMFKAKCDLLDSNGINSFSSYSMPLMIFDVRQAFGRLIRSITDSGLFVLLDSRALKKSYGGNILRSLPRLDKISGIGETPVKAKPTIDLVALELDD